MLNSPNINIEEHVTRAKRASTHPAKLVVLSNLLDRVFRIKIEELLPGIESKLGSKVFGIRGSADLIFSDVVFEIKVDLEKEIDDANRKLIKYLQALYEAEPNRKHVGIATDVVKFIAYLPVVEEEKVVGLKNISELDLEKSSFDETILWLDSFLFSKAGIKPTADDIKWRFGPRSPTYALATDEFEVMWREIEGGEDAKLKLRLWAKNMEMVYGSKPEVRDFIDHTFLVTLVKLIVYLKLSETTIVRKDSITKAIDGEYFRKYGILNLIEEDFFAWLSHPIIREKAVELVCGLARELLRYDMSQIDEDLFKEIYQEIVGPSARHKVGEYYTPEWLSELTLREALKEWKKENKGIPKIIDPACGSGTFLTNAIRLLREEVIARGGTPEEAADLVLSNVVGIDINPLAVVIARANYIIALGEDVPSFNFTIPIYISDSIKIPSEEKTRINGVDVYKVDANGYYLYIPIKVASDRAIFGQVLEGVRLSLEHYRSRKDKKDAYKILERWSGELSPDELRVLRSTLDTLIELMNKGRDTIWTFWLNNTYAPIALKESRFDVMVGNPPWIAMRYFEDAEYQNFLKKEVIEHKLLDKKEIHLFTQMEMATLFFCKASEMYLKKRGVISFVMPRSVLTGALHHAKFKFFIRPQMKLAKILDLEEVSPLFNVPSCVLICVRDMETRYPISASKYAGRLERKNERLPEARKIFEVSEYEYKPPTIPTERSPYYDQIKAGAAIYPRCFYFIEFDVPPMGWVNIRKPAVRNSSGIAAKPPWTNVKLKGSIESDFIYVTLLGGDIVRFGYTELRPVVLPVEPTADGYKILDEEELMDKGFIGITDWLEKVQKLWEIRRTEKAAKSFPRVMESVNYQGLLTNQKPQIRYSLMYNSSGTNLVSCVIDKQMLPSFQLAKAEIKPVNFIADKKTHFYETDSELEAHYLCSVLNSEIINSV